MKEKHFCEKKARDGHMRVLVVDDSAHLRECLVRFLTEDGRFVVVGCADNGRSAVQLAAEQCPDLVLMDVQMPEMDGLEAMRRIKTHPQAPTVVLVTLHDTLACRASAKAAGADGFVSKATMSKELPPLLSAIHRRHAGSKQPLAMAKLSGLGLIGEQRPATTKHAREKCDGELTQREREILQLIAEDRSSKEVADWLQISVKTVRTHRSNLMRKLNLHSAIQLVHYAIRNKLIAP